jgi:hypothetical protein
MSTTRDAEAARALIDGGDIVIRVAISALPLIAQKPLADEGLNDSLKVSDAAVFAADLVRELNREEEDGTTRIHRMFDGAIMEAIEQGACGVESRS